MMFVQFKITLVEILLIINIGIFLILGFFSFNDFEYLINILSLNTSLVYIGLVHQLFTFNFLHINPIHLILNMFALYNIGHIVFEYYGFKKLFSTYVLSGIFAGLFTIIGSILTTKEIVTIGASGAIFGMCGLLLGGSLKRNRFGVDLPINFYSLGVYILISILIGFSPGFNINNWAHLGGLIFGFIYGLTIDNSISIESKFSKTLSTILYFISVLVLTASILLSLYFLFL